MTFDKAFQDFLGEVETITRFCDELADPEYPYFDPGKGEVAAAIGDLLRTSINNARGDVALAERDAAGAALQ